MNRRYYITPPTTNNLPAFIAKRYVNVPDKVRELIKWSRLEYNKAVREATLHKAMRFVKFLHEEYSAYRVLAESEGFRDMLKLMNDENWNLLDARERRFIRRAYHLYKALGGV